MRCCLIVAMLLVLTPAAAGEEELAPLPRGQVSEWIRDLDDVDEADDAQKKLVKLGAVTVPKLIEAIDSPAEKVRLKAVAALGQIGPAAKEAIGPLIERLASSDRDMQAAARRALTQIGKPAIGQLRQSLRSRRETLREEAARVLSLLGPGAVEATDDFIAILRNRGESERIRFWAIAGLKEIGPPAKRAVPDLIRALDQMKDNDRATVALALGKMGPHAEAAVPALIDLVTSRAGVYNEETAIKALVQIGEPAVAPLVRLLSHRRARVRDRATLGLAMLSGDAVPELIQTLETNDFTLREHVIRALQIVGEPSVAGLIDASKHEDPEVRLSASRALAGIEEAADLAIPGLVERLGDNNLQVRFLVVSTMGQIGPAAKAAVPALIEAFRIQADVAQAKNIPETVWRDHLRNIIRTLGNIGEPAVPALVEALADEDALLQQTTLAALIEIGNPAVDGLVEGFAEAKPRVKRSIFLALKQINPPAPQLARHEAAAVPIMLEGLRDAESPFRITAATVLAMLKMSAVPGLIQGLHDRDLTVRIAAAQLLMVNSAYAEQAIPALLRALRVRDEFRGRDGVTPEIWRGYLSLVAAALGRMGKPAIPSILEALKDDDPTIRFWACAALHHAGYAARETVPQLIETLNDKSVQVRLAAAAALGSIGPAANDATKALLYALKLDDPILQAAGISDDLRSSYRSTIAYALAEIGDVAVAELIEALDDEDVEVRKYVGWALLKINPNARMLNLLGGEVVPRLITSLKDKDRKLRMTAAQSLGQLGPLAAKAVPTLIASLSLTDDDRKRVEPVRDFAEEFPEAVLDALSEIGEPAVPELMETALGKDEQLHKYANDALLRIAPTPKVLAKFGPRGVPVLMEAIEIPERKYSRNAVDALALLGNAAVAHLVEALVDKDKNVQHAAELALTKMGDPAVSALLELLSDPREAMRLVAARALGGTGPATADKIPAPGVVPALIAAYKNDEDEQVRSLAGRSVRWLAPEVAKREEIE